MIFKYNSRDITMSINPQILYEFGHIYERLYTGWEERFERIDYKRQRFQGKVKANLIHLFSIGVKNTKYFISR